MMTQRWWTSMLFAAVVSITALWTNGRGLAPASSVAVFGGSILWECLHGRLTGVFPKHSNDLTDASLEPGDILLCHNPGGGYGYWTHAALYVGGGQVVDASDFVHGVTLFDLGHYRPYAEVAAWRVRAAPVVRRRAVEWSREQVGKLYDPLAGPFDTDRTYCSKLVWDAYRHAGLALAPAHPWLLPDDLGQSSLLVEVGRWRSK